MRAHLFALIGGGILVVVSTLSMSGAADAQISSGQATLDDTAVETAIKAGVTRRNLPFQSTCVATTPLVSLRNDSGYARVVTTTTAGYIAMIAELGKQVYNTITLADIGPELRRPMIHVLIGNVRGIGIKQIILKSKTVPEAFVAPEQVADGGNLDELRLLQRGALGGLAARFSYDAVRNLPNGDIDVVLLSGSLTEYRCKIGRSDRAKLFPGS